MKITVLCLLTCTKAGSVHARLARGPPRWQVRGSGLTKPRSWRGFAFLDANRVYLSEAWTAKEFVQQVAAILFRSHNIHFPDAPNIYTRSCASGPSAMSRRARRNNWDWP